MPDTPKHYTQILDLITAPKEPSERERGSLDAGQLRDMRKVVADKDVIGIGVTDQIVNRTPTGRLSVCFYVDKKVSASGFDIRRLIPGRITAPDGQSVSTEIKMIRKIRPQTNNKPTPCQSGFSVAHADLALGTGTVGAIVRKGRDLFILSNSHVLAKSGTANLGDVILYPGQEDGGVLGVADFAILADFEKFTRGAGFENLFDAALARILPKRGVDLTIRGVVGAPTTMAPARGMSVIIRGRTSGDDGGLVTDADYSGKLTYDDIGAEITFSKQVLCEPYSLGGDSGALVVARDFGAIVGLHVGGNGEQSMFSPIEPIIKRFGFQFINAAVS